MKNVSGGLKRIPKKVEVWVIYAAELNLYFCVWLRPSWAILHIHDNHLQILKGHAPGFFLAQNSVFYVIPGPLFLKFCFGRRLLLLHKVPTYTTFLTVHIQPPSTLIPRMPLKMIQWGSNKVFLVEGTQGLQEIPLKGLSSPWFALTPMLPFWWYFICGTE